MQFPCNLAEIAKALAAETLLQRERSANAMSVADREAIYRFEGFILDLARGALLTASGEDLSLRRKSFELLRLFVVNAGRLLDHDTIIRAVGRTSSSPTAVSRSAFATFAVLSVMMRSASSRQCRAAVTCSPPR